MLKLSALSTGALIALIATASAETLLERGSYLVNAVMGCDGCHTPRPGGVFDMTKRFSGGSQIWDEKNFTVRGSNITPDPETGIGSWSEADIKRALTEGVRPSGVPLAPQMPFAFYKILAPRDLDAVAVYIKSVAPVRNQVPPPVYKAAMHAELIPEAEKPIAEEAAARSGQARLLSRHHRPLHGVSLAAAGRHPGLRQLERQGRLHIQRSVRRDRRPQHLVAQDGGHRRLDRRGGQACADTRCRARRSRFQAANGAPSLFQQNDRR